MPRLRHAGAVGDLFDEPELLLVERTRGFALDASYDVLAPDGRLLATIAERSGGARRLLGQWSPSTYEVRTPEGVLLHLDRPGSLGAAEFGVTSGDGTVLGVVGQENLWGAPQFSLHLVDGRRLQLRGGGWGSRDWTVSVDDPTDALVATVHREHRDALRFLGGADTFRVSTDPAMDRTMRAVVVSAVVALDAVRDAQRRRQSD